MSDGTAQHDYDAALEELRPGLEADGFELSVESVEDGTARVLLAALPSACLDCLVPDDTLIAILVGAFQERWPEITSVALDKRGFDDLPAH